MHPSLRALIKSVLGALLGLALGLMICKFAGESPIDVLKIILKSCFGSPYDFGMTLFYTAPLILTGLAVAIPFQSGLFNIGAEGQLNIGALAAASAGVLAPSLGSAIDSAGDSAGGSAPLAIIFATLLAFVSAGVWGLIPGILKARRGSHEVITTIMLNFVAAGLTAYFTIYVLKDPESVQAQTLLLPENFHLKPFEYFEGAPMGWLIFALVAVTILLHGYLSKSKWGYQLKAVGQNELAAETYGMSKEKTWMSAMFIAGGAAGLVGLVEVLGNSHRYKIGFSADYGFVGIAVALVARGNVLGILPAAFLFGILQKGAGSLDLETEKITRDLSYVVQGLIILGVSAEGLWEVLSDRLKTRFRKHGEF